MAIFHFSVKTVSRGKGQSVVAKAAYNARDKIRDEQTGKWKDYVRAGGVLFSGIFAPKDAPEWTQDRAALWNEVELAEKRKDAQLAREITIGLPHELTDEQRQQLVTDFVREEFQRRGMIADVNIHAPGGEGDDRNYHAHILLTMREIGPDGFGKKVREWNGREELEGWREAWERIQNRYLERHGHEARVDRRTLEDQGIEREPTIHLGPHAHAMEQEQGIETERGQIARESVTAAQETAKLKQELAEVEKEILLAEREAARKQPWERTSPALHFEGAALEATDVLSPPEIPSNLRGTAAKIWTAYNLRSRTQQCDERQPDGTTETKEHELQLPGQRDPYRFVEALEESGIRIAIVTKDEAERSHREAQFARAVGNYAPAYREGEFVGVNQRDEVFRFTERNTGEDARSVQSFLASVEWKGIYGLDGTRHIVRHEIAEREAVRQSRSDEMMAERLERATNIDAPEREITKDNFREVEAVFGRGLDKLSEAAVSLPGVFGDMIESLFAPPTPRTPEQIKEDNRRLEAAAVERGETFERFLYNEEHERISTRHRGEEQVREREGEDWRKRQDERERQR